MDYYEGQLTEMSAFSSGCLYGLSFASSALLLPASGPFSGPFSESEDSVKRNDLSLRDSRILRISLINDSLVSKSISFSGILRGFTSVLKRSISQRVGDSTSNLSGTLNVTGSIRIHLCLFTLIVLLGLQNRAKGPAANRPRLLLPPAQCMYNRIPVAFELSRFYVLFTSMLKKFHSSK
uniref:Uncharacterized protein n=1 Tax=Glossina austeni TaxID=7395 RepID=A0A1A9VNG0_GLOAU